MWGLGPLGATVYGKQETNCFPDNKERYFHRNMFHKCMAT